jgi:hypothetical protein
VSACASAETKRVSDLPNIIQSSCTNDQSLSLVRFRPEFSVKSFSRCTPNAPIIRSYFSVEHIFSWWWPRPYPVPRVPPPATPPSTRSIQLLTTNHDQSPLTSKQIMYRVRNPVRYVCFAKKTISVICQLRAVPLIMPTRFD